MIVRSTPAPCSVMDLSLIVTVLLQVQFPAGITTMSPSLAELIADCTLSREQLEALIVAAAASAPGKNDSISANLTSFISDPRERCLVVARFRAPRGARMIPVSLFVDPPSSASMAWWNSALVTRAMPLRLPSAVSSGAVWHTSPASPFRHAVRERRGGCRLWHAVARAAATRDPAVRRHAVGNAW